MPQIQFYHLTSTPMERAVPKLVDKAYSAGFRVQLVLSSEEQAEYMDQVLWIFEQGSFVPHGRDAMMPVCLSCSLEAKNDPTLLFVTEGSTPPQANAYQRILDLFDGNSEEAVTAARARWKQYKDSGHEVSYFKQNDKGGWEKAA